MFYNHQSVLRTASFITIMTVLSMNVTAHAAIKNPGLKTPLGQVENHSTSFSNLTFTGSDLTLDWRSPEHTIEFDLMESDWITALSLVLSIDPIGRVDHTAPVYVQLNTGKTIKINTKGKGFDARVKLKPSDLRETGNQLKISVGNPRNAECLLPQHGQWSLNLSGSELKLRTRAKSQNYVINDLKETLSNPIFQPERIGLISKGPNAAKHHALLAQSIGLRMETSPNFTTTHYTNEVDFIIGDHNAIKAKVRNKSALQKSGPKIFIDSGRPLRVFLTGDTKDDVDRAVQAFAAFEIPQSEAHTLRAGLLSLQPRLRSKTHTVSKAETRLSQIAPFNFDQSWSPGKKTIAFNLDDPLASTGEVILRLDTPSSLIKTDSQLTVSLNKQTLGFTPLDRKNKAVSFQIPEGLMRGQNNTLSLQPRVRPETVKRCSQAGYDDNALLLGARSTLKLSQKNPTPIGDVSHLMATGAPFSDMNGENTVLVLPKDTENYHASLQKLAKFAKVSGESWAKATVTRDSASIAKIGEGKNILFLAPSHQLPQALRKAAPKTFRLALDGQASQGIQLTGRTIKQYAENDIIETLQDIRPSYASKRSINRGGIATLFSSPFDESKVVGVLTNTPRRSFKSAMQDLKNQDHWNAMEGSVARWNKQSVLMTDLSIDLPNFVRSKTELSLTENVVFHLNEIKSSTLAFIPFDWLDFNFPKLDFKGFEAPSLNLSMLKTKLMPPKNSTKTEGSNVEKNNTNRQDVLRVSTQTHNLAFNNFDQSLPLDKAPQTQENTLPSFLDNNLPNTQDVTLANLDLRGLSHITDEGSVIETTNDNLTHTTESNFLTTVNNGWQSLKAKFTQWLKRFKTQAKNETSPRRIYQRTDKSFSLGILLFVLAFGGLLIRLIVPSHKKKLR